MYSLLAAAALSLSKFITALHPEMAVKIMFGILLYSPFPHCVITIYILAVPEAQISTIQPPPLLR